MTAPLQTNSWILVPSTRMTEKWTNEMTPSDPRVYDVAGGEVAVWAEPNGIIALKVTNKYNDPAELTDGGALELARILVQLVEERLP